MSLLSILTYPDSRLTTVCAPVDDPRSVADHANDMLETMYDAPGRGLAAPQVGVDGRLFVMDETWKQGDPTPIVCINPQILAKSQNMGTGEEACLSIPGIAADVARHVWIDMSWFSPDGAQHQQRLTGFAAVCAQHEYDHLDGLVIFDRLNDTDRAHKLSQYKDLP